jgi:hypothetical protein
MKAPKSRREKDGYERRGDEIYDRVVAPRSKEKGLGKFVLMEAGGGAVNSEAARVGLRVT